jgi:hypothetical protein
VCILLRWPYPPTHREGGGHTHVATIGTEQYASDTAAPAVVHHVPQHLHDWRMPLDEAHGSGIHQLLMWRGIGLRRVCAFVTRLMIMLNLAFRLCRCCARDHRLTPAVACAAATAAAAAACFQRVECCAMLGEHHARREEVPMAQV